LRPWMLSMSESDRAPNTAISGTPSPVEGRFRLAWSLSLVVSEMAVVAFFAAANLLMGRDGMPLGGDTYTTYQPWIKEVLSMGPLQFALNRHLVEVLYPIIGSIPVRLGVAITTEEIYFPIVLAVATVAATALLAREFKDPRVVVLSVAFTAGWFAIYRMGADFHGQFLAFPFLLVATTLLLRIRKTTHSLRDMVLFVVVVGLATLAHVETTAVFVAIWVVTFLAFELREMTHKRRLLVVLAAALLISIPVLPAAVAIFLAILTCGATCRPYPVLPAYWLEVLGPEVALAILGIGLCVNQVRKAGCEPIVKLVLIWSLLTIVVGAFGYLFPWFDLAYSDRTLVMIPIPLLSAMATVWLIQRGGFLARHANLIMLLILVIPAVTAPAIFAYLVPQRFRYYPPYIPG